MSQIYQIVQELRTERNIKSTRQLERLCGLSEGTIKKWKGRLPTCESLIKVSKFFNVSTDYLLGLSEEKIIQGNVTNPNLEKIVNSLASLEIDKHIADIVIKVLMALSEE